MTTAPQETSSLLLPLSFLPNELMELIFEHYLSGDIMEAFDRRTPTRLGLVCREWRKITIHCPDLWRALRITRAQMRNMWFLPIWLERSKQAPLSVGIWTRGCPYASQVVDVLKTFAGLNNPHTTMLLEELTIDLHWVMTLSIDDELQDSETTFPLLKKLRVAVDLDVAEGKEGPECLRAHHFLQRVPPRAPKLQTLAWSGSRFKPILLGIIASHSIVNSLTEITLGTQASLTVTHCMTILSTFTSLRICIFDDVWNFDEDDEPVVNALSSLPDAAIINTIYLQKLVLIGKVNPFLILAQLKAPSLKILTIAAAEWRVWNNEIIVKSASTFSEFLSRSASPLRELIVENIPMFDFEWKRCLGLTSNLGVLEVYDSGETHSITHPNLKNTKTHFVLEALAQRELNDGSHLAHIRPFTCPMLQVLVLRGRITAPDGFLAQLAEDRSAPQSETLSRSLEIVQVEFVGGLHKQDKERLQDLSAAKARTGKVMKAKVSARL